MFSLTDGMTREERRDFEREQKRLAFEEHLASVLDRAPELDFLSSRTETEKIGAYKLKHFQQILYKRHLSDLEIEVVQKIYQTHLASKVETRGCEAAPDGLTLVRGYVQDAFRQRKGSAYLRATESPNTANIVVRDDRGFLVQVTCPQWFITGKPKAGIPGPGSLQKLIGWRVEFEVDLMPSPSDQTVGVKRPISHGGIGGSVRNPKLLGPEFE